MERKCSADAGHLFVFLRMRTCKWRRTFELLANYIQMSWYFTTLSNYYYYCHIIGERRCIHPLHRYSIASYHETVSFVFLFFVAVVFGSGLSWPAARLRFIKTRVRKSHFAINPFLLKVKLRIAKFNLRSHIRHRMNEARECGVCYSPHESNHLLSTVLRHCIPYFILSTRGIPCGMWFLRLFHLPLGSC